MKKTSIMKQIAVFLAAAVLASSISVTAFASGNEFTNGDGIVVTDSQTITFRKEIVVKNDEAEYVYTPDITYSYVIDIADAEELKTNPDVTDTDGNSIPVRQGISGGVTLTDDTAVFTSQRLQLTGGKGIVPDDITAQVHLDKFETAGIYRYVITEQDNYAELTAQGITRDSSYVSKRYLDVYISNTEEGAVDPLKVSGYVLFVANDAGKFINGSDSSADTIIGKTDGFVDTSVKTGGGANETSLADTYYTYNLTVQVDITGSLANEETLFPITVTTAAGSASLTNRMFDYYVTVNGTTKEFTGPQGDAAINNPGGYVEGQISCDLAKGDSIVIYGLPGNTSFNVKEQNADAEENVYKVTVSTEKETLPGKVSVSVGHNETISAFSDNDGSDVMKEISNYVDYTTPNPTAGYKTIKFTNTLNDISLTGVVLRIAPYVILLAAAVLLGIFCLKSRRKKVSEDIL